MTNPESFRDEMRQKIIHIHLTAL